MKNRTISLLKNAWYLANGIFLFYVMLFIVMPVWIPDRVEEISTWWEFGNPGQGLVYFGGMIAFPLLGWITSKTHEEGKPYLTALVAIVWILMIAVWFLLIKMTA